MVDEAEIAANVEAVKRRQEARDDAEKTKEFKEMRKRNEAQIEENRVLHEKLRTEKCSAERIRLRQQEGERIRQENLRVSAANKGIKPKNEYEKKLINAENLKGSVREAISKTPGVLDRVVTGVFTPVVARATGEIKPKQTFSKGVVQESRQMSKALASSPKKPVTGGKVGKPPSLFQVTSPGDKFVNSLFVTGNVQQQPGKQNQPQKKIDPMSGLDDFVRRL